MKFSYKLAYYIVVVYYSFTIAYNNWLFYWFHFEIYIKPFYITCGYFKIRNIIINKTLDTTEKFKITNYCFVKWHILI